MDVENEIGFPIGCITHGHRKHARVAAPKLLL